MKKFPLLLFLLHIPSVFACSCRESSFEEQYFNAKEIYIGKIISAKYLDKGSKATATLYVENIIKGVEEQQKEIYVHSTDSASCGMSLILGKEYLILADEDKKIPICSYSGTYLFDRKELVKRVEGLSEVHQKYFNKKADKEAAK